MAKGRSTGGGAAAGGAAPELPERTVQELEKAWDQFQGQVDNELNSFVPVIEAWNLDSARKAAIRNPIDVTDMSVADSRRLQRFTKTDNHDDAMRMLARLGGVSDVNTNGISINFKYGDPNTLVVSQIGNGRNIQYDVKFKGGQPSITYHMFVPRPGDSNSVALMGTRLTSLANDFGIKRINIPSAAGSGGGLAGGPRKETGSYTGYRQWLGVGAMPKGWGTPREPGGSWRSAATSAMRNGTFVRYGNEVYKVRPEAVRQLLGSERNPKFFSPQQVAQNPILFGIWSQYGRGGPATVFLGGAKTQDAIRNYTKLTMARKMPQFQNLGYGRPHPRDLQMPTRTELRRVAPDLPRG